MRKLKKLMCIALCLVMSLQLVSFTALADSDLSEYTAEVNLLTALGITDGIHFQSQADNLVTRYEFAILLTRLLNVDASKYSSSTVINDVSNAQKPYAAYLMDNGIMKGDGQGNFLPNSHVTVHQALVTVMRILGYDVIADAKGGTEGFYAEVASKLELDAGIMRYRDDRIQYKNVIRIFYNALHTGLYVQTTFGNEEKFATDYDRTLLYDRFEIKIAEGRLMANDVSSIDGGVLSSGTIRIGDIEYDVNGLEVESYLGYEVTAYYKQPASVRQLVFLDNLLLSNSVTYDTSEISYSEFEYSYTDENGNDKQLSLDTDFVLIINGVFTVYSKDLMLPASGTVTLVNTDNDKKYETVVIRDERIEIVQSYNATENSIGFKYGGAALDLDKFDEAKIKIYNANGRLTDTSALKEWTVVTILENDGYLTIYVSNNSVRGSVEELLKNDSNITVTVGGEEFMVSAMYKNGDVAIRQTGTFYLDANGRIVAFREGTDLWNYGFIFDAALETALDSVYKFEIFDESCFRETKVVEAAGNITVDGEKCSSNGISKQTGANVLKQFEDNPQFVRFQTNGKGQLTQIQTTGTAGFVRLDAGKVDNTFDSTTLAYFGRVMGKIFAIGDTAPIYIVPVKTDNGATVIDYSKKNDFVAGNYDYINGNATSTTYYTMGYGKEKEAILSDAVIIGSTSTTFTRENSVNGMVKKISTKLNEDGEPVQYIEIVNPSAQVQGGYVDPDVKYTADIKNISEFDIVQFSMSGNTIKDIKHIFDKDGNGGAGLFVDNSLEVRVFTEASKGWHKWMHFPIYNIEGSYIQYQTPFGDNNGKMLLPASGTKILICSTVNGKTTYRAGALTDIRDIAHFGSSSDVVTYMYDTINAMYVYEN